MLQQVGDATTSAQARDYALTAQMLSYQRFHSTQLNDLILIHSNLTKRGWGGLLKCSHGSEMALECNGISTPEWVRVWGINTPLSKTSRCSVRVRPVRPVGPVRPVSSNKLAIGPDRSDRSAGPVRPVTLGIFLPSVSF